MLANNIGILAIDQGTTSSRAILFGLDGTKLLSSQHEFTQIYPDNGWVEHDPEEIWNTTLAACKAVIRQAREHGYDIKGIGITNQRETTVMWDKVTGKPIYNAIVWQDRRTSNLCEGLSNHSETIRSRTGLILDPYFSASKINWILDNVKDAREWVKSGNVAFGTIDTFLIWRLTKGKQHVTDVTNASRTCLFNIHSLQWDDTLLDIFNVPRTVLPEVKECADEFGITEPDIIGLSLPIAGVAGDQQSALIGQCCFDTGQVKSTYGTGCFVLANTGHRVYQSKHSLLTTIGYKINGETHYALEGSIFTAGASVQWLRDELKIIEDAKQTQTLAESLEYTHGVILVPAFAGLGAPHWRPDSRAAIFGMTRATNRAHFARAALESVCFQTYDLLNAMSSEGLHISNIWVDGGMVRNDWLCQFLSDILQHKVLRPENNESTALGCVFLAGLTLGLYQNLEHIKATKKIEATFSSSISDSTRVQLLNKWERAINATLSF